MATTLAEVLQHFGPQYLRSHAVSTAQARAWRAIVACRTPALGGERLRCDGCGAQQWGWHSCRNRHCPRCQRAFPRRLRARDRCPSTPLKLTLPIHRLAGPIQSNDVYLSPCTSSPSFSFASASDKRYSLLRELSV